MHFLKMVQKKNFLTKSSNDNGIGKQQTKYKTLQKPSGYYWGTYPSVPYQLHPIILLHSHAMLAQCHFHCDYHGFIDSHAK